MTKYVFLTVAAVASRVVFLCHVLIDVEWRTEIFNILNTTKLSNPASAIESSTFGQITTTSSNSRLIEFGLRLIC